MTSDRPDAHRRPLAVLHVVNELHEVSYNRIILSLALGLPRDRYALHVGCVKNLEGPMRQAFTAEGVVVSNFGQAGSAPAIIGAVRRYIRREGIDMVHTHVLRSDLVGGVAARLAGGVRLISTKHNFGYVPGQSGWLRRSLAYWPAMCLPDHSVFVTDAHRLVSRRILRLPEARLSTIHNGIDPGQYYHPERRGPSRDALGLEPSHFAVFFAGRLVSGKGVDCLLRAGKQLARQHSEVRLVIVGEGAARPELERLASALGIADRVIFTGFRSDMAEVLAAADAMALPSLSEGLPLSLLEAMAAGVPVVATPVGGVPELVEDNVTGLLVPAREVEPLAAALSRLASDAALRERLRVRGRAIVGAEFSNTAMVRQYNDLYDRLLPWQ